MESIVEQTFSSIIMLEQYNKSDININVQILESDGSVICSIINAVTMALLHSGIMMNDICVACTVGSVNKQISLDLNQAESNNSGTVPIAIAARTKDIIYLQLDNKLNMDQLSACLELGNYNTLNYLPF